jgi:hypothetical protein
MRQSWLAFVLCAYQWLGFQKGRISNRVLHYRSWQLSGECSSSDELSVFLIGNSDIFVLLQYHKCNLTYLDVFCVWKVLCFCLFVGCSKLQRLTICSGKFGKPLGSTTKLIFMIQWVHLKLHRFFPCCWRDFIVEYDSKMSYAAFSCSKTLKQQSWDYGWWLAKI